MKQYFVILKGKTQMMLRISSFLIGLECGVASLWLGDLKAVSLYASALSHPHHPLTCQNHRTSSSRCRVSLSLYGTMWHFSAKALSLSTSQTRSHRNISGEIRTLLITRNVKSGGKLYCHDQENGIFGLVRIVVKMKN